MASAAAAPLAGDQQQGGFYCSTSGTYFSDKESLAEHYKSDFHRYNLKRKVAGLPPVNKEWFEARKAQLTSASAAPHARVWYDPLTKRKFQSQQTYEAHVRSKRYQELVKASGEPAPAPLVTIRQLDGQQEGQQQQQQQGQQANGAGEPGGGGKGGARVGFTVKAPNRSSAAAAAADAAGGPAAEGEEDGGESSGWETASDDDDEPAAAAAAAAPAAARRGRAAAAAASGDEEEPPEEEWEEWDVCVSLFDNRRSASMQANLEYMYKTFGFYLPDSEFLEDPEGLLRYLGAKLQYGKVPLYSAGDDPNARQFRSLHAVQRHMVDRNQCRVLYEGNEEEYQDFYDYSRPTTQQQEEGQGSGDEGDGGALALALGGLSLGGAGAGASAGWELAVGGGAGAPGGKALGSREMARYYRQRPRPADTRQSVLVNRVAAQYRLLGVATAAAARPPPEARRAQREQDRGQQRKWLRLAMRANINNNLPKNVTF